MHTHYLFTEAIRFQKNLYINRMIYLQAGFYFLLSILLSCNGNRQNSTQVSAGSVDTNNTVVDTTAQNQTLEQQIIGQWQWWKTNCCYRTPEITFADTTKPPLILKFEATGNLEYWSGDSLTNASFYEIKYGLMNDKRPVLKIGDRQPGLLLVKGDTLIIDYGYMDLQTEYYLRRKRKK